MYIYKEKPGVISNGSRWVCIHRCYMYTGIKHEMINQFPGLVTYLTKKGYIKE